MTDRFTDDDDWVGEPPEGRYTSDRADPQFWAGARPERILVGAIFLVLIVILVVVLL